MTKSSVRVENLPKQEIYLLYLIIAQQISLLRTEDHNIIYKPPHLFLSSRVKSLKIIKNIECILLIILS